MWARCVIVQGLKGVVCSLLINCALVCVHVQPRLRASLNSSRDAQVIHATVLAFQALVYATVEHTHTPKISDLNVVQDIVFNARCSAKFAEVRGAN